MTSWLVARYKIAFNIFEASTVLAVKLGEDVLSNQ
jgi:hypothetical protein